MRKAFKYRIYFTSGQRRLLERQLEKCRWVYNETLAIRKHAWDHEQRTVDWYETKRLLPMWKDQRPGLKLVHAQVLQNVTQRVNLAFNAFFRRIKEGAEEPGYPRFKGIGRYGVRLAGDRLILSKVGALHVVLHRPVAGIPKTVTLNRASTGKWFVCFACETDAHPLDPVDHVVGVDVGLVHFATLSTGEQIDNPRFYRRDEADLKRVQQRKDAAKNAENWPENAKQKHILARIHARIANRRVDFAHKRSRELVNRFQVMVFEDLAPHKMGATKGRGMRKSIMDVAWSQFIRMTSDKAAEAGRTVILVDPRNTSKLCSQCSELVQKTLRDRTHTCPACGLVMDRDVNAAINILKRGLQALQT
jgi:putative transposase